MNITLLSRKISKSIKKLFGIKNLTLSIRRKKQSFEKIIYRKKYTADDIIEILRKQGVKPGHPLVIHSAFGNLYNYQGTADELLDKLIEFLGPDGTLCLPDFPKDKYNPINIFDVRNTPSAAGYYAYVYTRTAYVAQTYASEASGTYNSGKTYYMQNAAGTYYVVSVPNAAAFNDNKANLFTRSAEGTVGVYDIKVIKVQ